MTDNEIIKALECFAIDKDFDETYCQGCAFETKGICYQNCSEELAKVSLDLINRQKAEIERLTNIVDDGAEVCHNCHSKYAEKIKQVKAEAVKEFWDELKKRNTMDERIVSVTSGDTLVKEMVGEG